MYYAWKRVKVPNNNGLLTKYLNKYSVKMAASSNLAFGNFHKQH